VKGLRGALRGPERSVEERALFLLCFCFLWACASECCVKKKERKRVL